MRDCRDWAWAYATGSWQAGFVQLTAATPASSACAAGRLQGLPSRLLQALMLNTKQPSRNPKPYSPHVPQTNEKRRHLTRCLGGDVHNVTEC